MEIIRFIFEEVDMPKNCPFGGTFVLVMGVAKMDHCSCANVLERHGASVQNFRSLNTNIRSVFVTRKDFFPTLQNGTRVRDERIRTKKLHCGLLGCALTEEQPNAKDKQRSVNETELSPSKLCEKKKEMTVVFKLHQGSLDFLG